MVVRAEFDSGTRVPAHSHLCDYVEIVLEGSEMVGREWRHAGDVVIVQGGTVYGPLIVGEHGLVKLVIFRDGRAEMKSPAELHAGGEIDR